MANGFYCRNEFRYHQKGWFRLQYTAFRGRDKVQSRTAGGIYHQRLMAFGAGLVACLRNPWFRGRGLLVPEKPNLVGWYWHTYVRQLICRPPTIVLEILTMDDGS